MKKSILMSTLIGASLAIPVYAENPVAGMMETSKDAMYSMFDMATGIPDRIMEELGDEETGPSSVVAFTVKTRAAIKAGDPAKGEAIAKESKCKKCHSENGIAEDPEDPNIAGQLPSYTYKQLMDYKSEHRDERSMAKAVKKLNEEDFTHLAAWYGSLPSAPSMLKDTGVAGKLVYKGDPKRMLKPCATCHGQNAEGGQHDSAALVGQSYDYFIATMEAFKEGDRGNDIYSRMRLIAEQLTEEEIVALADYYAAEPPAGEEDEE